MQARIALSLAVSLSLLCTVARAEQFVLVDVDYTHSEDTTSDSHYRPKLPANTPASWTSPIDYSKGSVHIILDVKTKPSAANTKLQVCFEGTPAYACTDQSPTYTKVGRVEWDSPFSNFWYGGMVDWSKGIKQSPLILKDDDNNKPAGDPDYMPTDLHVQVTLVSPGAKFVPPPAAGSGGAGGTGGSTAGMSGGGAGGSEGGTGGRSGTGGRGGRSGDGGSGGTTVAGSGGVAASGGAGSAAVSGRGGSTASEGTAGTGTAGTPPSAPTAGATGDTGAAGAVGTMTNGQVAVRQPAEEDSGCRTGGSGVSGAALWMLALAGLALRRRQTRSRKR